MPGAWELDRDPAHVKAGRFPEGGVAAAVGADRFGLSANLGGGRVWIRSLFAAGQLHEELSGGSTHA